MKIGACIISVFLMILVFSCNETISDPTISENNYAAFDTTNYYVGIEECASCHKSQFDGFSNTGMGLSYDLAHGNKSVIPVDTTLQLHDDSLNLDYEIFWEDKQLTVIEYRIENGDTVHYLKKKVDHIVGSGHHTNSHIEERNGYLHQMPFTYYIQEDFVDLPPGFENGFNSRFSRKIGLECMSCHNSYPDFVTGSENKFNSVPNGINCERCHGPGGKHVELKKAKQLVDVSKEVDYSIVNPAKLEMDLQFDVCQRCHLQGNSVLEEGKSFYDFLPGMKLSEVMTVYLPRYEGDDSHFIMASHADRLQMSACFIESKKNAQPNKLFPTEGQLTCITCHNPHQTVINKGEEVFNHQCISCHEQKICAKNEVDNCVSCHMPKSSAIDIPHVRITDHFIRKNPTVSSDSSKTFIGLVAVNNPSPSYRSQLEAYVTQFEKFDKDPILLDSASVKAKAIGNSLENIHELVHYYWLTRKYQEVVTILKTAGTEELIATWKKSSYDNKEAWTLYRISECLINMGVADLSKKYIAQSVQLAPYHLEFRNKYATVLLMGGEKDKAELEWSFILKEDNENSIALGNLGYLRLLEGESSQAKDYLHKAIKYDPDYEKAWLNLAQLYIQDGDKKSLKNSLENVMRINPHHKEVKQMLQNLE